MPETSVPKIKIPAHHFENIMEVAVGLARVAEQLDATAEGMRHAELDNATANEIGMWGGVLESLTKKLDETMDRYERETEAETSARVYGARVGA